MNKSHDKRETCRPLTIDIGRLLCLSDIDGPCANAVKDSQRTKTNPEIRRTLTLIWGTDKLPGHAAAVEAWSQELNVHGARIESVHVGGCGRADSIRGVTVTRSPHQALTKRAIAL